MPVQITGTPSVIHNILQNAGVPNARPHERAGYEWIEVDALSDRDVDLIEVYGAKVHDPDRL